MVIFINDSQVIGSIIEAGSNLTGSLFLTVLLIMIVLITVSLLFRLPIEILIPILLPLFIVSMAFSTEYLAIGGLMLIFLAIIFSKRFFLD